MCVSRPADYLEWIELSNAMELPESDDGTTGPITIPTPGFPFWDSVQTQLYVCNIIFFYSYPLCLCVYVCVSAGMDCSLHRIFTPTRCVCVCVCCVRQIGTNGLLSFGTGYNSFFNQQFPGSATISSRYLVAPFWDDVDIRGGNGDITYKILQSGSEINLVNNFVRNQTNFTSFEGTWMIVVFWDRVHPFSFGNSDSEVTVHRCGNALMIEISIAGEHLSSGSDNRRC